MTQTESSHADVGSAVPDLDGVTAVRLLLPDMHGVPRSKTVSPDMLRRMVTGGHSWPSPLLAADLWQNVPASSMAVLGTGNTSIFPHLPTLTRLPFEPDTAIVICEAFRAGGEPAPTPRSTLSRVLAGARDIGYDVKIGAELEFFVFEGDGRGRAPFGMNEWFTSQAVSKVGGFVKDLHRYLPDMGLPVYEVFNEHAAGQVEINLSPAVGMPAMDRFALMKVAVKEIARLHGLHASMMVKPRNDGDCAPSGLHVHQVLCRAGENAFRGGQEDGGAPFSRCATQFIAGQLHHAPAITAFAAPTVNSYKRYRPGTWAPVRAGWGVDNRSAMVRGIIAGDDTRIENRIGASDANGYLLVAAQVAAGLDGVRHGLVAHEPATHDLIEDESFTEVPMNLLDSVRALEADEVLREALGAEFCRHFIAVQRATWDRFQDHVSDWEIREYADVI